VVGIDLEIVRFATLCNGMFYALLDSYKWPIANFSKGAVIRCG
jgi:hypothetical protein